MLAISQPEKEAIPALLPLWTWRPGYVVSGQNHFRVIFNLKEKRIDKSFSEKQHESREKAWIAANEFRNETSKNLGLTVHIFSSRLSDTEQQRIAGMLDGDGCIRLARKGNFVITMSQSQDDGIPEIFAILTQAFPHSSIYKPKPRHNAAHRLQYEWAINGMFALPLLELMAKHAIMKSPQARLLFTTIMETKNISCPQLYDQICSMKKIDEYQEVPIDESKITAAYIAGLFMAEGYVGVTHDTCVGISITQKSCTRLLSVIHSFFNEFGRIGHKAFHACAENACFVINVMMPYLCGPKREQCELALKLHSFAAQLKRDNATKQKLADWKRRITELKKI